MKFSKVRRRRKIRYRIRRKIKGDAGRPRLSIFRSNREIYCQLIDDIHGATIVSASSKEIKDCADMNKTQISAEVGKLLAKKAMDKQIQAVSFDRSGYLYHGRVKALADGAREGGLKF